MLDRPQWSPSGRGPRSGERPTRGSAKGEEILV